MRVLVTGGAGFIGSHLCERLLKYGCQIDVIDDLSTGSIDNLKNCIGNKDFKFIHDSVQNEKMMYTLIDKCDMVYHLAAAVGVRLIVEEPVRTIETNIRGTEVVLDIAKKFGKKVLLASTSEIYGKNGNVPFKEEDDCLFGATTHNRWSYACSKAIDEFLGFAYYRQYGLPVLIVRFFNTIGERQTGHYGMVVPRFVRAALTGEPITVYGNGSQSRCFCYVQDVIDAVIALVNDKNSYGQVFNIGSSEEITIGDLAKKIKELTDSPSEIRYIPYEEIYGYGFEDMQRRVPCLDKIYRQVGFRPKTSLKEALERIIAYHKEIVESDIVNV